MAKLERELTGSFDALLDYLNDGILTGSASASWEDGSDTAARISAVRCVCLSGTA